MIPIFRGNIVFAIAIIVGTTVGAGMFGIPYAIAQSGIIPSIFYFFLLGGAVMLLHLFLGEVVLRTEGNHRLPGYARMYLKGWGERIISFSTFVGLSGTILAYLVLGGEFLRGFFLPLINISSFWWTIWFWFAASFFILRGIRLIAFLEFWMAAIFIGIIILILFFSLPHVALQNFSLLNSQNVFLPYGVLLFSFAGWLAVPEAAGILRQEEKKYLKLAIIVSSIIVAFLYFLFAVAVVGVSGIATTEDALSGLVPKLGGFIYLLGALFGILAVASSLLVLGDYLKNALQYDYQIPSRLAAIIAVCIPLFLFLVGFREFLLIIGFIGALLGAAEGVVISFLYVSAKKSGMRIPEYSLEVPLFVPFVLIGLFLFGAVAELYLIASRMV
jgi:amino acid permease